MKRHQTFRLDEEIIESAIKYSKSENRTISNVYETAVIEYLKARGLYGRNINYYQLPRKSNQD